MLGWKEAFDFNHDGNIDPIERSIEMDILLDDGREDDECEEWLEDEIEAVGLDRDDLEMMDEDERREVMEEAGLDPDDYDFW